MSKYTERLAMRRKGLQEAGRERAEKLLTEQTQLQEDSHAKSFVPRRSKLRNSFNQRQRELNESHRDRMHMFIAEVVKQACPVDLSHVPLEEMVHQIAEVRETFKSVITENPDIWQTPIPDAGTKTAVMSLGNANGDCTAVDMIKAMGTVCAQFDKLGRTQTGSEAKDTIIGAANFMDTFIAKGNDEHAIFTPQFEQFRQSLMGSLADNARSKVVMSIKQDREIASQKQTIVENCLTEDVQGIARVKFEKEVKDLDARPNILREVFNSVKLFNEHETGDSQDYMNETVFNLTVLEVLNELGEVKGKADDICLQLRKDRRSFLNEGHGRYWGGAFKDAVTFKHVGNSMASLFSGIASNIKRTHEIVDSTISWLEDEKKNSHFDFKKIDESHLKNFFIHQDKAVHWRFYFLLDDTKFEQIKKGISNEGKDTGWFDFSYKPDVLGPVVRIAGNKSVDAFISLAKKYKARADEIAGLIKKDPRNAKAVKHEMKIVAAGAMDFDLMVKNLVRMAAV
jgi:hypothetical protein